MATPESCAASLDSFIVRVYRIDPKDYRNMVGVVELVDGSGDREPFCSVDELSSILHRNACNSHCKERRADRAGRVMRGESG
jgi:hypothetical protein